MRDEMRTLVRFENRDLRQTLPAGPFDLLLCRNVVLTYFEPALAGEVLGRMLTALSPWGRLVIGGKEDVPVDLSLNRESRAVYALGDQPRSS